MIRYKTIMKEAEIEQIIDRSRFIGHIRPAESREEAEEFIAKIRSKHKDASHNVPAFVIGEQFQLQWASDDGEPQGTSGAPIVQMLVREGITNLAVVITRYFGGIKLGTGGLVRAYTGTTKLVLAESGICAVKELDELKFRLDYTFYGKLQNMAENGQFDLGEAIFDDAVTISLLTEPENTGTIKQLVLNLTGGNGMILSTDRRLVKVQI